MQGRTQLPRLVDQLTAHPDRGDAATLGGLQLNHGIFDRRLLWRTIDGQFRLTN